MADWSMATMGCPMCGVPSSSSSSNFSWRGEPTSCACSSVCWLLVTLFSQVYRGAPYLVLLEALGTLLIVADESGVCRYNSAFFDNDLFFH